MKKGKEFNSFSVWATLGFVAFVLILIVITGNILLVGSKLGAIHVYIEWIFYIGLCLLFVWAIGLPIIGVINSPTITLERIAQADYKTIKKITRKIINNEALPQEYKDQLTVALALGSDLREPLSAAIAAQQESAGKIIHQYSVLVFVSTTISQNGRLDAIAVLVSNFRLVKAVVDHMGFRPAFFSLIKIYSQIFITALVSDQLDDIDYEGAINQAGISLLSAIPGAGLIVNSILDGTINALLTLRIGYITRMTLLNTEETLSRSEIRKRANREARNSLVGVWKDALPVLPNAIGKAVQMLV